MAAGGTDRTSRDEQPWSRQPSLLGRFLQAPVGASGVPHAGKAAVEHPSHQIGGACGHQRQRHAFQISKHDIRQYDVYMAVNETRHKGPAATVDDVRVRQFDSIGRDFFDSVTLDDEFGRFRVEHFKILEMIGSHSHAHNLQIT